MERRRSATLAGRAWPGSGQCPGSPVASIWQQAPVRAERHQVAEPAIMATPSRSGASIRVVNIATGAAFGSATGDRQGRGDIHQEALAAQRRAVSAALRAAARFHGHAVKAMGMRTAFSGTVRREQPEDRDGQADCYRYQADQHDVIVDVAAAPRPRAF
jgi:hypothetical protein